MDWHPVHFPLISKSTDAPSALVTSTQKNGPSDPHASPLRSNSISASNARSSVGESGWAPWMALMNPVLSSYLLGPDPSDSVLPKAFTSHKSVPVMVSVVALAPTVTYVCSKKKTARYASKYVNVNVRKWCCL